MVLPGCPVRVLVIGEYSSTQFSATPSSSSRHLRAGASEAERGCDLTNGVTISHERAAGPSGRSAGDRAGRSGRGRAVRQGWYVRQQSAKRRVGGGGRPLWRGAGS